jgi:hypothetical protein
MARFCGPSIKCQRFAALHVRGIAGQENQYWLCTSACAQARGHMHAITPVYQQGRC